MSRSTQPVKPEGEYCEKETGKRGTTTFLVRTWLGQSTFVNNCRVCNAPNIM